jgi:NTE family protein
MPPRSRTRLHARKAFLLLSIMAATAAAPTIAAADDAAAETRPRIGLVLSGGGARGAAHIGVIRALEEMQVPSMRSPGPAWVPWSEVCTARG